MVNKLNNPFVFSAVIISVLIYTGTFKPKNRNPCVSLIPTEKIESVSGIIISNPNISSDKKSYSLNLKLLNCGYADFTSEAKGNIKISMEKEAVEAVYPGKLWSTSRYSLITEEGNYIKAWGYWSKRKNAFICQKAINIPGKMSFIKKLRCNSRLIFKRLMYSWGKAGGLVLSLLSGSREYADDLLCRNFRDAGLSHILALSGMHLTFFSGLFSGISGTLLGKKSVFWAKLCGIIFFVWFAGLSPSLLRALIVSIITLLCGISGTIETNSLAVLSLSFLLHLFIKPEDIYSYSFMLSYSAIAGIILFSDFFNQLLKRIIPRKISNSISSSCGAQLATTPISATVFKTIAPGGIIATTIMSPVINVFLTFSFAAIILCLLMPFLSKPFGIIINRLYDIIFYIALLFSKIPCIKIPT